MKPAYSMWFWAALTLGAGMTNLLAPHLFPTALGMPAPLPESTAVVGRLLGIALIGYGAGYLVAAVSADRSFMRTSVLLRYSILPAMLLLVFIGWLPQLLLALGVIDLAGAIWTRHELRARDREASVAANHTPRNLI